jgi:hypothetical protein
LFGFNNNGDETMNEIITNNVAEKVRRAFDFTIDKFPLVHAEGTVVTAVPDPETRTFTPITPISLGKVGWRVDQ